MKKTFLVLAVIIMQTNLSFSQERQMSSIEISEYFTQEIFDSFKKSNPELFKKLISSSLKEDKHEGKKIIYSKFENYTFFDNSDIVLVGQLNETDINVFDLSNQKKTYINYSKETDGIITVDKETLLITNFSGSTNVRCRDYAGFALCYTVTLGATAASGPLMAFVWGSGTAYCFYSHCRF